MTIFQKAVEDISKIIKIDSSESAPSKGAPFGEGAKRALDMFLNLAEELGFECKNFDGYAGEVKFGEGRDFAILCHLDVVPAGKGWTKDPFGGEIDYDKKRVWGRGATDDKGPAVCALYAMYALKEKGFKPSRTIKLIVGCNEESGWKCIDYYSSHAVMPEEGFSPDADFPVIYAEKGILQLALTFPVSGDFSSLKGGERPNMVCDYCEANPTGASLENLIYSGGKVISRGKSAHGSTPEKGINAIPPMLDYLGLKDIRALLFEDGFNLSDFKDETGSLTFSPNVICGAKDEISVVVDVRYPATYLKDDVLSAIYKKGVKCEILHEQAPLYNDKNSFLISTLCEVYNEVTGKHCEPVAIGGGTYARALKCGAAFGPEEEGEESVIHQADEYITFEKIQKCLKIYTIALERLTK